MTPAVAIAALAAVDAELDGRAEPRRTLAPGGERARGVVEILGERLVGAPAALVGAFVEGTCAFVRAQVSAFPDNLLWDLDLPLVTWWTASHRADDPPAAARRLLGLATELQGLFGRATALRFRYAHDFTYGYDWVKWVGRGPATRAEVGPFDLPFLEAMRARGRELLEVIATGGDPKYPALLGSAPRNPFPFSREPAAELAILRALADADRIPVPAWRPDAQVVWARPWAAWREQAAAALGLALDVDQASGA